MKGVPSYILTRFLGVLGVLSAGISLLEQHVLPREAVISLAVAILLLVSIMELRRTRAARGVKCATAAAPESSSFERRFAAELEAARKDAEAARRRVRDS